MNKEEIKHFKAMLRQGSLRHMNILLDDKFQKELLNIIKDYEKLQQENKELKEDLKFVLEQVLGAFVQNWCIDWNFNDIRKKYNISDKYDWNSDVDE